MDQKRLREWLKRGLAKTDRKRTATGLAKLLGVDRTAISKIFSGQRGIKAGELRGMADYINEPIPLEATPGVAEPLPSDKMALYIGKIAAGTWIDMETQVAVKPKKISAAPIQIYENLQQGYLNITDDSCDKFAKKGETIWVVDYDKVRKVPQHNDFVVVQMTQLIGNRREERHVQEWTVRRVARTGGSIFLKGLSSVPGLINDVEYSENSLDLKISYLVIFKGQYLDY